MCLAICMYLVTGTVAFLWKITMTIGIFLLKLLGRSILFVCALIYTVARPKKKVARRTASIESKYPEDYPDFDEDLAAMSRMSLESLTPPLRTPPSFSRTTPLRRAFRRTRQKYRSQIRHRDNRYL